MTQLTTATLTALAISEAAASIIIAGLENGETRDELIIAVFKADMSLGINGATAVVQKALVAAGLERTPKQKRASFEDAVEALEGFDLTNPECVESAMAIAESEEIPAASAKRYLKEMAEALGVSLADTSTPRSDTKISALEAWFKDQYRINGEISRKTIMAQCESIGMTKASGQYYVNMFTRTLAILQDLIASTTGENAKG